MRRMSAQDIMSTEVVSAGPRTTLTEAARAMRSRGISGLPVLENGRLVGIITEGDLLRRQAGVGGTGLLESAAAPARRADDPQRGTVDELMTRNVVTAGEDTPAREVARLMARCGVNRVPILRDEALVGIVTRADVLTLFDRRPSELLTEVRRALAEDLLIDPDSLDIIVSGGTVALRGQVSDERDIGLVSTVLSEIEGIGGVDVSGLTGGRSTG